MVKGKVKSFEARVVLHYPRLDTVMMVEKAIRDAPNYPTKNQLWRSLPKQVQYQTLSYIVDYLEEMGKILIKDGEIIWTWDPEGVRKLLSNPNLRVYTKGSLID
jgi:hypothetical protein